MPIHPWLALPLGVQFPRGAGAGRGEVRLRAFGDSGQQLHFLNWVLAVFRMERQMRAGETCLSGAGGCRRSLTDGETEARWRECGPLPSLGRVHGPHALTPLPAGASSNHPSLTCCPSSFCQQPPHHPPPLGGLPCSHSLGPAPPRMPSFQRCLCSSWTKASHAGG